ncbi:hypothetical protein [Ensifer aridi]|uniref:hypothetical protein n=1 Tax=Ensifer aridi TaxID=1708715 RepID=UPI00047A52CE|nr:hypothetical protein [Ensifer aridi]
MMRAETYAIVNLAALNLIEAASAAYFATEKEAASRHEFRVRQMLRKIAAALGYEVAEVGWQESQPERPSEGTSPEVASSSGLRLVSTRPVESKMSL